MRLVLLEEDRYFVDMCSSYIRTSEHAEKFMFTTFSNKEQGFDYIERSKEPYILLVHESFMPLPERVFQQQHGCLIILSDTSVAADVMEYPVLCKYQPLNQFFSHIISHFNEYTTSPRLRGDHSAEVISVYSAVGGSGKTVTAAHLARELVYQGKRIFYLNLEQMPSYSWLESGLKQTENNFSRILYYGKIGEHLQTAKVELYKRQHPVMGFDYFPGVCEPAEMEEISEKDTQSLIRSVLATGAYDYIILDLDSALQHRTKAALRISDQVVWLVLDDRVHWEKTQALMNQLLSSHDDYEVDWGRKLYVVVNKFNGNLLNERSILPVAISGYLPYIPEWKSYAGVEILQVRGVFSEGLSKLSLLSPFQAEAHTYAVG
ncbi:AAA family ATPase [Paenibacillus sp. 1_12]|uniref:AAA family ATPase n=1 Tax=Paenibacillus sp. 1_12 TaxID=1566278 RepID=UPI00210864D1|nr:AAA family ATPase [Paenibacillus sp. 1_12]